MPKTTSRRDSHPASDSARMDERTEDAALIADLTSSELNDRLRAQHSLITRGRAAVPALLAALQDEDPHRRSAAAQVLAVIAEPSTAAALAGALSDDEAPVRWIAAEGLIALGPVGLAAALHALVTAQTISPQLKDAVRHILLKLRVDSRLGEIVEPVLRAMHKFGVDEMILVEAHRAFEALEDLEPDSRAASSPVDNEPIE